MKLFTFRTTTHPPHPSRHWHACQIIGHGGLDRSAGADRAQDGRLELDCQSFGTAQSERSKSRSGRTHESQRADSNLSPCCMAPTQGFFLIDTGVAERFVKDPAGIGVVCQMAYPLAA
jgi:hypothetical protein